MEVVPKDLWRNVNEVFVRFGQEICTPTHPKHDICPIREMCDMFNSASMVDGGRDNKRKD